MLLPDSSVMQPDSAACTDWLAHTLKSSFFSFSHRHNIQVGKASSFVWTLMPASMKLSPLLSLMCLKVFSISWAPVSPSYFCSSWHAHYHCSEQWGTLIKRERLNPPMFCLCPFSLCVIFSSNSAEKSDMCTAISASEAWWFSTVIVTTISQ